MENNMNLFKKSAFALSLLSAVSFAQASVIINISFEDANTYVSTFAGATTINFEGSTNCPTEYICSGDFQIRENADGSVRGSAPPAGATPLESNWLTVPNPKARGTARFTLDNDYDYFGMFWGSVDTYNYISFEKDGIRVGDLISGSTLRPMLTANGHQQSGASNRFVNFLFDGGSFDTVVLRSDRRAFETDNHAFGNRLQTQTVEASSPSIFALFGLSLLGLAWSKRRQK